MVVTENQEGEFPDVFQFVGVQGGEVEAASQICVAAQIDAARISSRGKSRPADSVLVKLVGQIRLSAENVALVIEAEAHSFANTLEGYFGLRVVLQQRLPVDNLVNTGGVFPTLDPRASNSSTWSNCSVCW